MNIYKLKEISDDLMKIVCHDVEFGREKITLVNDRPIGMKKDDWDILVAGVMDISDEVEKEINRQDKELLLK